MFSWFQFDFKKFLIFVFIFALPLISIQFQRGPGETPWYLIPVELASSQVSKTYFTFSTGVRETTGTYLNLMNIKRTSSELNKENSLLKAQLLQFEELKIENQRLAQLLEFKSKQPSVLLAARVIAQDLFGSTHRTFTIDRGSHHGVLRGQAVISSIGAVGTVLSVQPESSQILAVTDRYSVIDALVARTRARGIVEGRTETKAQLKYLHRMDDVQAGDLIVTSGLDQIFPQGFPIAIVVSVDKKAYDITQKVEVETVAPLSRLEEVFVVLESEKRTQ